MNKTTATPKPAEQREYILPIDHEHEGEKHKAGAKLMIYPDQISLIESVAAQLSQSAQ